MNRHLILICALLLTSCGGTPNVPPEASGPAKAVQTTSHQGTGIVKGFDPAVPSIEIDHEDIKDLMPAMQMDFHVSDKSLLGGIAIGDRIDFTIEDGVGGLKITAIKKK